jgi:hypothetical protein
MLQLEPESWSATVRRLEAGFFAKDAAPLIEMGQFSTRVIAAIPYTTQFFRLQVGLASPPSSSSEIWVICVATPTGNRIPPPGATLLAEAKLDEIRSSLIAALPHAALCFTTEDREGFSRVVGVPDRAVEIAAAVAVVKYYAAWDEFDPITVAVADEHFAVSIAFTENDYRAVVRRFAAHNPA